VPDSNKLGALHDAGFRVVPTCSTCEHFTRGSRAGWGHCSAIPHDHKKHGARDTTGTPTIGWCPRYNCSETELNDHVGNYVRFFQPDSHAE
jgi:hypothetical protein